MQMGFYFDQTRCIGCAACVVACKDWHDVPAGPASWRRLIVIEKGKYPDVFVAHLSTSCHHCAKPSCVSVCPTGAVSKREQDGIVTVNQETCLGKDSCGACLEACLYNAPQFGSEPDARMQKCDLCQDRLAESKKPICVGACPTRALDAGSLQKLEITYESERRAEGFVYSDDLAPSLILKPKSDRKNLQVRRVVITP